ncbi:MAG: tRNA (adenosine(37)-N6)-threonylcarbamoyltransferase complex ATPase subunit type 1 TsaE [Candidatus Vogelbacteria bacterium]|nr:tRNA (adenosine(37)-N6)-threonylcarbamoyltransferase complex ATPase subunit type 1 TsaE [Candidatus Vogelbacteria bacterium]
MRNPLIYFTLVFVSNIGKSFSEFNAKITPMVYETNSLKETYELARMFVLEELPRLCHIKNQATVVGLFGELGAGKTSFTQGVAKALGVEGDITSPTFVLEKIYKISKKYNRDFERLVHIDAYRLDEPKEILKLGWEELISDPKNLILIEWPERVSSELQKNLIKIKFESMGTDEDKRKIAIECSKKQKK